MTNLKRAAEVKFENAVKKDWDLTCFPLAVSKVYEVSPPGEQGKHLREIALEAVVDNSKKIFEMHNDFETLLEHIPAFSAGLARALSDRSIDGSFKIGHYMSCHNCRDAVVADADHDGIYYCPQVNCYVNGGVRLHLEGHDQFHYACRCQRGHRFYTIKLHALKCVYCNDPAFEVDGEAN